MKTLIFALITVIAASASTTKEKLQYNWKLTAIEEFGNLWDLEEKNKDDCMNLGEDGNFEMTFYNEKKKGTWSFNESGKTINFKSSDKKFFLKLKNVTDSSLIAEYQHKSLIRTNLHFSILK
jgi:DNA-directed RNA polymerase alpha subunit